jgi:hypothetical protein
MTRMCRRNGIDPQLPRIIPGAAEVLDSVQQL